MKLFEILAIWCIWFILTDDMADCRGLPNRSSDFGNVTLREVKRAKREGALSIDLPSSSLTGGYRNQDQDPDFSCKDRLTLRFVDQRVKASEIRRLLKTMFVEKWDR